MVDRDPFIYEIRNFGSYWFFCGPKNKPTIRTTWFRARIDQVIRVGGASEWFFLLQLTCLAYYTVHILDLEFQSSIQNSWFFVKQPIALFFFTIFFF